MGRKQIEVLYKGPCAPGLGNISIQIVGFPGPLIYYSGDVIELNCDVTGSPTTQISWYKVYPGEGLTDPDVSSEKLLFVGSGATLKMKRALVDDSALYKCSVMNCSSSPVSSLPVEVVVLERFQTLAATRDGLMFIIYPFSFFKA